MQVPKLCLHLETKQYKELSSKRASKPIKRGKHLNIHFTETQRALSTKTSTGSQTEPESAATTHILGRLSWRVVIVSHFAGELVLLNFAVGKVRWDNHTGKLFYIKLNMTSPSNMARPFLLIFWTSADLNSHNSMCVCVCVIIYNVYIYCIISMCVCAHKYACHTHMWRSDHSLWELLLFVYHVELGV